MPSRETTSIGAVVVALVCVITFVVGMLIQRYTEGPDGYVELFKRCAVVPFDGPGCLAAIDAQHEHGHTFLGVNLLLALAEALKALSIALLVSVFVSTYFERHNRERLSAALSAKAQQLATNVFDAMFGNSHPPAALDAIKRILERPLTREQFDVTYTLSPWVPPEDSRLASQKFITVDAALSAVTRNISDPAGSPTPVALPIAVSLPNPLVDELKPHVGFKSIKLNGKEIPAEALATANTRLQEGLKSDDGADVYVKICDHLLKPGECVRVQANYTMMKEAEDTEVLRSFLLCQNLTLTVIDKTGSDLVIRARAIHPGRLDETGSDSSFLRWELNDVILPQQGIMVWWKRKLPSAPAANLAQPELK